MKNKNEFLNINNNLLLPNNITYEQLCCMKYAIYELLNKKNIYFNLNKIDIINIINYYYNNKNDHIIETNAINLIISINKLNIVLPSYEIYKLLKIINYNFQSYDYKIVINKLFHKYFFEEKQYKEKDFFIYYRLFKECLSNKYSSIVTSNIVNLFYFFEHKYISYKFYKVTIIQLMKSISAGLYFFSENTYNEIIQKFNRLFPNYKNELNAIITLQNIK